MTYKRRLYGFYKKMKEMGVENEMMMKTVQALEKRNKEMAKICVNMEKNMNGHENEKVEWKKSVEAWRSN